MSLLPIITPCNDNGIYNFSLCSEFAIYGINRTSTYTVSYNRLLHIIHMAVIPDMANDNYNIYDYYISHPLISTDKITLRHVLKSLEISLMDFQFNNFTCEENPDTHPLNYIDTPIATVPSANFDLIHNNAY